MQLRSVDGVDEALSVLAEAGNECQILAGGTDVMIQLDRREISPSLLLHVEPLAELRQLNVNGAIAVGPLVTHRQLALGVLGDGYRAVAEAAATCGGLQTQCVGTVGGNVCNASPAADAVPALLVHDAEVTLRSSSTARTVPLETFIVGRRATIRSPDELLTAITLAPVAPRSGDVYLKVGRRGAMEVAIVGLSMRLTFDDHSVVADARIALASVGPAPLRAVQAEAALIGRVPDEPSLAAASEAVLANITPQDDLRATADYRRRVIPGLLRRAAQMCIQRAGRATTTGEGRTR